MSKECNLKNNFKRSFIISAIITLIALMIIRILGLDVVGLGCSGDNETFGKIHNIEMIFVEGGTFAMGCTSEHGNSCEENEKPVHSVTIGDFYIGKYEVTNELWDAVIGNVSSDMINDNRPVGLVSWNDAQAFIKRLNQKTGKNYRLPTEAEWEYAARGGTKSKGYKYSGSNNLDSVAWYFDNSGDKPLAFSELIDNVSDDSMINIVKQNNNRSHTVGTKQPNELGIYDMSGNLDEWVNDWYDSYNDSAKTNPIGPIFGSHRVYRGGNWASSIEASYVPFRNASPPNIPSAGFRLAHDP